MPKRKTPEESTPTSRKVIKLAHNESTGIPTPLATPTDETSTFLNIDFPSASPFSPDDLDRSSLASPSTLRRRRDSADEFLFKSNLGRLAEVAENFLRLGLAPAPQDDDVAELRGRKRKRCNDEDEDPNDEDEGPNDIAATATDEPFIRLGTPLLPDDIPLLKMKSTHDPPVSPTIYPFPPYAGSRSFSSSSSDGLLNVLPPPAPRITAGTATSPPLHIKPLRFPRACLSSGGSGGRNLVRAQTHVDAAVNQVGALVALDFAVRRLGIVPGVDVDRGRARGVCLRRSGGEAQALGTTRVVMMGRTLGTIELDYEVFLYGARLGRLFHVWDGLCEGQAAGRVGGGSEEGGRARSWDFWKGVGAEICLPDEDEDEVTPTRLSGWELW